MLQTSAGQIVVNSLLPEKLQDYSRVLDGAGMKKLLGEVARDYPERYREIAHSLSQVGWRAAQNSGGFSFGLSHLRKSKASAALRQQLQAEVQQLVDDDSLDDKRREEEIIKRVGSHLKSQQDNVYAESIAEKNPLAFQVLSKARGNKTNLNSLRGSDLLYTDQRDNPIPIPILRSYSEGLTPAEYFAGAYGARRGVLDLKLQTPLAGALSKQLNQLTHRLVVTDLDDPDEGDLDDKERAIRGLPVDTDDNDNEGALLAANAGPYKRNTLLTPKVLSHLKELGEDRILVRSPAVGGPTGGGVYSRDVGVREFGNLPGRGEFPGMAAAQALGEPISQGTISSKHTGGVAGEGKVVGGFAAVSSMVQAPKHVGGGATHSDFDGTVSRIEPAPAGGTNVWIDGNPHHVQAGLNLKVKQGDNVEAGDILSEGLPHPGKIVQHKGVGEGRRYFVGAFRDAMRGAGITAHRRNVELLARGLINHVRLDDEMGDWAPDDVVSYSDLERSYTPRDDASEMEPSLAAGRYLERPALHHSIGTRVRPSMIKDFQKFGVKKVTVHADPPPFHPEMIRGMASLADDPDWMVRQYGSGLKGSFLEAAHRGRTSDESGTSFVPSLSRAVDFGRTPGSPIHTPDPGWAPKPPWVKAADSQVPGSGNLLEFGTGQPAGASLPTPPKPVAPPTPPKLTPAAPSSAAAPSPAPPPPAATPLPPAPQRPPNAPYYGGYQSAPSMMGNPMYQALAPYAARMGGPLGALAIMAGVDQNALMTLLQGGGTAGGPAAMPQPSATATTQPSLPAASLEATPPAYNSATTFQDLEQAAAPAPSPPLRLNAPDRAAGLNNPSTALPPPDLRNPYFPSGLDYGPPEPATATPPPVSFKSTPSPNFSPGTQPLPKVQPFATPEPRYLRPTINGPQDLFQEQMGQLGPGGKAVGHAANLVPGFDPVRDYQLGMFGKHAPGYLQKNTLGPYVTGYQPEGTFSKYVPGYYQKAVTEAPATGGLLSRAMGWAKNPNAWWETMRAAPKAVGRGIGNVAVRSVAPNKTVMKGLGPVQAMSTGLALGTPEGGGGSGALDSFKSDYGGQLGGLKALWNYLPINAPSSIVRDTAAMGQASKEKAYSNQLGESMATMGGQSPMAQLEASRLIQNPRSTGMTVGERDVRLNDIKNMNPAGARTQQEAATYVQAHDFGRYEKMLQRLAQLRHDHPDQNIQIDWTSQDGGGNWGVPYEPAPAVPQRQPGTMRYTDDLTAPPRSVPTNLPFEPFVPIPVNTDTSYEPAYKRSAFAPPAGDDWDAYYESVAADPIKAASVYEDSRRQMFRMRPFLPDGGKYGQLDGDDAAQVQQWHGAWQAHSPQLRAAYESSRPLHVAVPAEV